MNRGGARVALACLSTFALVFLLRHHRRLDFAYFSSIAPLLYRGDPQVLNDDFPDDLGPLTELCRRTEWVPDRVWQCEHAKGGLSNVYNMVLACIRLAIEAGATALILPKIWVRSTSEPIVLITGNLSDIADLSYLFDVQHFRFTLGDACPRMKIFASKNDITHMPEDPHAFPLRSTDLGGVIDWRRNLDYALGQLGTEDAGGGHTHKMYDYILLTRTLFKWPIWEDSVAFGNNFKSILHFRQDARGIAAAVLAQMNRTFSGNDGSFRYFGVHLRTGADLGPEWDPMGFEVQYTYYIQQASAANVSVIYLGSGVPKDTKLFAERAWNEYGIKATTKHKMLSPKDLKILNAMSSDQQACVDFEVLSRAARFTGMHRSSFAWQVAFRMHTKSDLSVDASLHDRPENFQDEFSTILNTEPEAWFDFFWWCTWP